MKTQEELNKLNNEQFVQAIRNAIRVHKNLTVAVNANQWNYSQVYDRLRSLGKRLRRTTASEVIDVE